MCQFITSTVTKKGETYASPLTLLTPHSSLLSYIHLRIHHIHSFQGFNYLARNNNVAVPLGVGRHYIPRNILAAFIQNALVGLHVFVPLFGFQSVGRVVFPMLGGVVYPLLQAHALFFGRYMQVEF